MHLSEGILPLKHAVASSCLVSPFLIDGYRSHKRLQSLDSESAQKPFLNMAIAICFAMTLLPIPVPVVGASSHMCATPLLALVLGPRLAVLPAFGILLLQALFFAHGGISTLGANVLTLGVVGPWVCYGVFSMFKRLGFGGLFVIGLSIFLGSLSVYFADTFLLASGLSDKQSFLTTFKTVTLGFLPVQAPLSLLECVLCASIIKYLANYREDFLPVSLCEVLKKHSSISRFHMLVVGAMLLLTASEILLADAYPAIDDTVFSATARNLNGESKGLMPKIEGELQLSLFSIGFFYLWFCGWKQHNEA